MPDYRAPVEDMMFTLTHLVGFGESPGAAVVDPAMVETVLSEAAKLAEGVLAPLNIEGDRHGAVLKDGVVTTAPGFKEAYRAYCDGGWNAVPFAPDFGGQGLPWAVAFPVQEMWQSANMSFGLCPLLNQGAVEAILSHGSEEQKQKYLPKLISGEWTGTMNLTEPQAGSDLGAVRTRAEPQADGTYRLFGQKIFITYGEHDMAPNIIHLVLARLPDAPEGAKGISLFIVPKFLDDGTRNDVTCVSIEHKMGIHASPTCTMVYGDDGGAVGYLVGAAHQGLKYMFTMMNNARLSVGLQGVAVAERAVQAAVSYARERVQGRDAKTGAGLPIIAHADVRRMLLTMSSLTFAARALAYDAAVYLDRAHAGEERARERVDLLTPIVKSWGTEVAQIVTHLATQVYGGMGFVEETGVAQYQRDARILPIYEGTNGIQAADLVFRKVQKTGGALVESWLDDVTKSGVVHPAVLQGLALIKQATDHILGLDVDAAGAKSHAYLMLIGTVAGAVMMERTLHVEAAAARHKVWAEYYLAQLLPLAHAYHAQAVGDVGAVLADSASVWI